MRVYDYTCQSCGATHEHFVTNSDVALVVCKDCGGRATREICAPRFKLPGDDPAYPTAWDQWEKRQVKRVKEAEKKNDSKQF